ncbi:MAG TPA: outer membrane lipoprotein chaperone LolA [Ramlibacter sp.]|uniref:outer membrane lipoprotein chaperone LolA n=1 Tax=Ramlibacter sp. TaxID=1917967 RepID=UPI002BEAA1C4|nr:outer membrane lipoprotein chaperone LolA [Ramlibacter sp.]HVZ43356.1 outer membrane lipoprotein chaperone LolA [Ramlibacter sp.]
MKKLLMAVLAFCWAGVSMSAFAGGMDALESFIRNAKTGHAEFTQTVTSPAREGQAARTRNSSGTFDFQRPNHFRFIYRKPFEQTLVADGETLWLYDQDLNQVTARRQAKVLGSTPAALIAASPDIETLRKDFELQELPAQDGMQWVQATPRTRDGQLRSMKAGFRGDELAVLEILDGFGQRSVMRFSGMQLNGGVSADSFRFTPPTGVDVVKQ